MFFCFFFCQGFPSQTLTIHRTARKGGYQRLFDSTTSTRSRAFNCNFVCEVTITFFKSQRLCLPDCYSMRFNTLLNYHLIDWLIDNAMFICLIDELILGFCYSDFDIGNWRIRTRIDYNPCITSEPINWHIMQIWLVLKISVLKSSWEPCWTAG